MELAGEILNIQWQNAPSDSCMLFSGGILNDGEVDQVDTPSSLLSANASAELE